MNQIRSQAPLWKITDQDCLLRVDLNIDSPMNNLRMTSTLPTLRLLLEQHPRSIIIMSHRGRPLEPTPALSMKPICDALNEQGFQARLAETIQEAHRLQQTIGGIIVLENLRFFPGEQTQDHDFALQLKPLGTWYVNDAWASMHNSDSSIALLPRLFDEHHKTCGLLVEQEFNTLSRFKHEAQHPRLLLLGGGKQQEKSGLLGDLAQFFDTIALGPLISLSGIRPQDGRNTLLVPEDYLVRIDDGSVVNTSADRMATGARVLTIGTETLSRYREQIAHSKTVVYNGFMGFTSDPSSRDTFKQLVCSVGNESTLLICGGDSVQAAQETDTLSRASILSTGGGATLAFLAGKKLPGLEALGILT